jgi:hypothetical protein
VLVCEKNRQPRRYLDHVVQIDRRFHSKNPDVPAWRVRLSHVGQEALGLSGPNTAIAHLYDDGDDDLNEDTIQIIKNKALERGYF